MIRSLSTLFRRFARQPRLPSLEIHIPISPTPTFFNMVRCFTQALRRCGGRYRNAPLILTVGDTEVDPALADRLPWLRPNGIELRWLPAERFATDAFFATALERFRHDFTADVVLMLDADVLPARPFVEMVERVVTYQALGGVIGYVSPFEFIGRDDDPWQKLYDHFGFGTAPLRHEHSGWGVLTNNPAFRYCPVYFNLGVLCAPREVMSRIGREIFDLMYAVDRFIDSHFRCQLALAAAIKKLELPYESLPLRYNFANHGEMEERHAEELEQVRFLHMNGPLPVPKEELFADLEQLEAFVRRPGLRGFGRKVQQVLAAVVPKIRSEENRLAHQSSLRPTCAKR
jgi:hypothetical protein